jgi:NAD(P)H-quinone oxidoreductase subunit M
LAGGAVPRVDSGNARIGNIRSMPDATLLKSTTRHIRLFTARVEDGDLVADPGQLTLDVDPDNEFLWDQPTLELIQQRFRELVEAQAGADLDDYNLRRIGSALEGYLRELLQAGRLRYNPDCRVLNYSMGLPRTPDNL